DRPAGLAPEAEVILVRTKADLDSPPIGEAICSDSRAPLSAPASREIRVSAMTGAGIDRLRLAVESWAQRSSYGDSTIVASTAARCRPAIAAASQAIRRSIDLVPAGSNDELTAMELRLALDELGHVVGAVYTDDILDRVFSRFCIGK